MLINSLRELSIYVHIPFCIKKCNYCDFVSVPFNVETADSYVEALCREIAALERKYNLNRKHYIPKTVYFGGGTPSILNIACAGKIFDALEKFFNIELSEFDGEFTLECNPCTITEDKLDYYKQRGVNRLSLGLQSASDTELAMLGRSHNRETFVRAFEMARAAGFGNINIDVMTAIPGQTMSSLHKTLEFICDLKPEHISAYSLILEENTRFYDMVNAGILKLADEETERKMYSETVNFLESYGYMRYEISNFAKDGLESRHNSGYWSGREYVGVGVNASSMVSNVRYKNIASLSEYINAASCIDAFEERNALSREDRMEEFMFLGLRMSKGVSKDDFSRKFQADMEEIYGNVIKKLITEGLILDRNNRISLTNRGIDYGNYVFSEFLL